MSGQGRQLPSLNETLGTLPSGKSIALSDDTLTKILRENYINSDAEAARQKRSQDRLDLFHDCGESQISSLADSIFRNPQVREWRKKFIEIAMFQNITKRVIREISAVYSEPATRRIGAGQETYKKFLREVQQDRMMRRLNQYTNLLNECVIWFRVSPAGRPYLRVVPPSQFWAVPHPNDPLLCVALILRMPKRSNSLDPHFLVLAEDEFLHLDAHGRMVPGMRGRLNVGMMPALLVHRAPPSDRLLDSTTGADLISAHKAVALLNTMMLKHQKSGTRQAVAAGDVGEMATGQPMDEEHLLHVPEGVSISTLDLGADPANYIEATRFVIKQVAANWGMPESVFDLSYQATSGFEIELKRTALREVRRDQMLDYRITEEKLAEIESKVLIEASNELRFNASRWSIDFGEIETPTEPMARLAYWEKLRQMGLGNTVEFMQELHPEMSEEEALEKIRANAAIEAVRVELMRALNMADDANSDNPGNNPDEQDDEEEDESPREAALQ